MIAIQPASGGEWIAQVVRDCDYFGILLRIVPEALLFGERRVLETLYPFEALHLPAVVLAPPHWDSDALFLKRLFDMLVAGLLLLLLSPLIGIIALILKLSEPGATGVLPVARGRPERRPIHGLQVQDAWCRTPIHGRRNS